ncbi:DUF421 domain-containing protein [Bacillus sp. V5-8f]|uniref:DUF421 domain-containing protein n=1 Tax=Bacillus sp. V5-8f TaxID=2053044 RepID=UPI000C778E28|nr:DUF421 domain-containing protein [Bacillus sp. V5-8f]PLT33507.1 hypothetical protein CUU64_13105 [Bacillus sp. V5-8f]
MPEWVNVVLRAVFFLIVLFLITKLLGKKQISQLSFFEYVNGITIGSIGAEMVTGLEHRILIGVLAIVTFAAVPFAVGFISLKNRPFRNFVEGKGSIFIKDGKIMEDNLRKERYTTDELLELLRKRNVFQVSDVEFAVLEPTGDLNVLLKKENQPITAKDLKLTVAPVKEPQTVIMDGELLEEPMFSTGRSTEWLYNELEKQGVTLEDVFLGQINSFGELSVDLFDDQLQVSSSHERSLLYATMKKCQADLELFALKTKDKDAKDSFEESSKKLQEAINKIASISK